MPQGPLAPAVGVGVGVGVPGQQWGPPLGPQLFVRVAVVVLGVPGCVAVAVVVMVVVVVVVVVPMMPASVPAGARLVQAGLGAVAQVLLLVVVVGAAGVAPPGRVRVVGAPFAAAAFACLPLQQAANGQSVLGPANATAVTAAGLLRALFQRRHQVVDQLVHRPAKVPAQTGQGKKCGFLEH